MKNGVPFAQAFGEEWLGAEAKDVLDDTWSLALAIAFGEFQGLIWSWSRMEWEERKG